MIRRTFLGLCSIFVLAQLSGCCWQRPGLFNRGFYPNYNSFGAPVLGGGPVVAPVPGPVFGGPPPDCVGCGGGLPYSAAPVVRSPEPLAVMPSSGQLPPNFSAYPASGFQPEAMGLPSYPAGKPMTINPGSTALPPPNVKEDPMLKKN